MKKIDPLSFAGYLGIVFLLNILPINGPSSSINHVYIIHLRLDYWIHAVMFLPWMGLSLWGLREHEWLPEKPLYRASLLIFAGILFAIACECMQFFTPWRTFNINDLIANVLGFLIGIPVLFLFSHQGHNSGAPDSNT